MFLRSLRTVAFPYSPNEFSHSKSGFLPCGLSIPSTDLTIRRDPRERYFRPCRTKYSLPTSGFLVVVPIRPVMEAFLHISRNLVVLLLTRLMVKSSRVWARALSTCRASILHLKYWYTPHHLGKSSSLITCTIWTSFENKWLKAEIDTISYDVGSHRRLRIR